MHINFKNTLTVDMFGIIRGSGSFIDRPMELQLIFLCNKYNLNYCNNKKVTLIYMVYLICN
jgi:hypothetical protein